MDFSGRVKQISKASRVYTAKLYVWVRKCPAKVHPRHASRLQQRAAQARRRSLWDAQQQLLHDRCDFLFISLDKKKNASFNLQELQIVCSKGLRIKVQLTISYQILSAGVHVAFWYVIEANFCTCVSALLLHTSCPTTPASSLCFHIHWNKHMDLYGFLPRRSSLTCRYHYPDHYLTTTNWEFKHCPLTIKTTVKN